MLSSQVTCVGVGLVASSIYWSAVLYCYSVVSKMDNSPLTEV